MNAWLAPRELIWSALFFGGLLLVPQFTGDYVLSVLTLILAMAFLGQAWNIMMGFAGQLSLGHSLYVGLGAYVAAVLFVRFHVPPAVGVLLSVAIAAAVGGVIGFLGFRFGVKGVYFALLTIAFAEFTRILFDHLDFVGGSSGLFLPVSNHETSDPLNLRGSPQMFYYVALGMTLVLLIFTRVLLSSRIGYYWLAIREDPEAAEALGVNVFRYKMIAVALSAGLTAIGGVFNAFYYNNLYPETIFSMHKSIEIILGPIIGGLGTLFGPILGAFVLTGLGEFLTTAAETFDVDGLKLLVYGVYLLVIVLFRPSGLWPWLRGFLIGRRDGNGGS